MASTDQNKAVVRRFMTEVLEGRNLAAIDEVLGPELREARDGRH